MGKFFWNNDFKHSIGQIHSFYGNFSILVRAYVYIKTLGDVGLKSMNRNAIINANYIKNSLKDHFDIPYSEGTLHEFVASGVQQKNKGVQLFCVGDDWQSIYRFTGGDILIIVQNKK